MPLQFTGKTPNPFRIDTHHHLMPPRYIAAERDRIVAAAIGIPETVSIDWTPQKSLDEMDCNGVATAILSIATPGVWFGNVEQARWLARECNDYGASLVGEHRGRFGMFAALPLPDVEGSLREIEYALDALALDGVCLMTNYGDTWPGDPAYAAVFDELNRRKAVVYFHPHAPQCCVNLIAEIPPAITEFPFDSTRAITSLLFSGTLSRCPNIRFIFSHGGGTLPMLAGRIASLARRPTAQHLAARLPNGVEYELKKLFYDTASITNPPAMAALRALVPRTQILFGSDYPFLPIERTVQGLAGLSFTEEELRHIETENGRSLFPRRA